MKKFFTKISFKNLFSLLILISLIIFFWNTIPLYPVKLFVVLLHEISHGIAAVLTGGGIASIQITMDQGGVCYTYGGIQFIILSAGYTGSLILGGILLLASSRKNISRTVISICGVLIFIIGVIYVSNFSGKIFTLAFSTLLIFSGYKAPEAFNNFILKILGLTSMLYAVIDILSDTVYHNISGSDASKIGELYFGNSFFWGIIWTVISLFFFVKFLFKASEKSAARG